MSISYIDVKYNVVLTLILIGRSSLVVLEGPLMWKLWLNGTKRLKTSKWALAVLSVNCCISLSVLCLFEVVCDPWETCAMLCLQSVQKNRGRIHPRRWERASSEGAAPAASDVLTRPVLSTLHQRGTGKAEGDMGSCSQEEDHWYWVHLRMKGRFCRVFYSLLNADIHWFSLLTPSAGLLGVKMSKNDKHYMTVEWYFSMFFLRKC